MIIRRVVKTGNSFGITIPRTILRELALARGDFVEIKVLSGKIIVEDAKALNEKMKGFKR